MIDERDNFPVLPVITGFFAAVLVLTPSASAKFIALGSLNIAGSTLFFPLSYLFNDILTEVYGYERSRSIIWIGFACQVFAALMYALIPFPYQSDLAMYGNEVMDLTSVGLRSM
jgi:uncharacterized PurR-regulated membrane protein YhhQ (DUF165 family)